MLPAVAGSPAGNISTRRGTISDVRICVFTDLNVFKLV
jgi:hypothetical protein